MNSRSNRLRLSTVAVAIILSLSSLALAQDNTATNQGDSTRSVASGQKMKLKGVVTQRGADTFTVKDINGVETTVLLTDRTSVKSKGGFLRSGTNYAVTNILRGLNLEVEGRGDTSGQLVAEKVRFDNDDLNVARALQARVDPVESRVGSAEGRINEVEQNAQRLSGQLDELAAVSNAARGGAKAAQETADAAISGVNATNERISALDDFTVQQSMAVNFKVGSAVLSQEAKTALDEIAAAAGSLKGFMIEVTGYASAEGGVRANKALSERREKAVREYLIDNHNISLRRFTPSYGFGELQAVADNTTREGREQNRRVEIKVLVSRGLNQNVEVKSTADTPTDNE